MTTWLKTEHHLKRPETLMSTGHQLQETDGGHDTFPRQHPAASTCSDFAQMNSQLTSHEECGLNATVPVVDTDILPLEEAPQNVEGELHATNTTDETSGTDAAPDVHPVHLDVQLVAPDVELVAPDATVVQPTAPAQPQPRKVNALKDKAKDCSSRRSAKRKRNENCDSQLWNDFLHSEIEKNQSTVETNKAITALANVARLWLTKNLGTEEPTTSTEK